MIDDNVVIAKQRPSPFDIFLVVIGPVILAAGYYMVFIRLPWVLVLGFVAGCALGAMAWQWPRIMGPVLIVLSIPALAYYLFLAYYTLGMPVFLVFLWGSVAFLVGGVGVMRRHSAARRPTRHIAIQAGLVGSLAAVFLLYVAVLWPPQAKAVLYSLPIMKHAISPHDRLAAGGGWSACWFTPQVTVPEALESATNLLERDGWTIVDSALYSENDYLISAQRGAYSLLVIYDPDASDRYCSTSDETTSAYMQAIVRRAQARQIP